MASESTILSLNIEPEIKQSAEDVYSGLGLSLSEAVNVFLHQSIALGGFPFEVRQPRFNKETEEAIAEIRSMESGEIKAKQFSSTEELFADLMSED